MRITVMSNSTAITAEDRRMTDMPRMSLVESLRVLHSLRTDEVVVTAMSTAREWVSWGSHPLDFVLVPSSMGQASSLGLGIALACPDRRVIACNGDGSTLMNLGSLITITAEMPENFTLMVFDNEAYEVTGGQALPSSSGGRISGESLDFVAIAKACGFANTFEFADLQEWQDSAKNVLATAGPNFVCMHVALVPNADGPKSPGPAGLRAMEFMTALQEFDSRHGK